VIASDLEGYRLAGGGVPRYVQPGEIDALRKEIELVCNDAALRRDLSQQGERRASHLDFSLQAQQYLDHYAVLVAKP